MSQAGTQGKTLVHYGTLFFRFHIVCYLYLKICIYLYFTHTSVQINKHIPWDTLRVAETMLVSRTSQRTKPSWRCSGKQQNCLHFHGTGWWPDCPERHKMLQMLDPFPAPHLGMKVLNQLLEYEPIPHDVTKTLSVRIFLPYSHMKNLDYFYIIQGILWLVSWGPVLRFW